LAFSLFIECGIYGIDVFLIEPFHGFAKSFTETLEMDYFAFTKELYHVVYIRVI
jgi:hypothetical protein